MTQKKNRNSNVQSPKTNGTPSKALGKKRPREEDSDEEIETKLSAQQVKKLKQMMEEDDEVGSSSAEEAEDDVSDDVEDSDDDEEDSEGDSEEEDSYHSGDTEEEFPEKVVNTSTSSAKSDKKQQPKPPVKQETKKAEKNEVATPFKVSQSNVLLFNLPRINETELTNFLNARKVHPESIDFVRTPVAVLGFSNEAAAKKAESICTAAAYSQSALAAVTVASGDIGKIKSVKNPVPELAGAPLSCVFVTSIPKSVTEKQILTVIGVEPKHMRMLTTGSKNHFTNACYIDCKSEADAKKAFDILSKHHFEGKSVRPMLKPQAAFNTPTDTSFVVANVPFTADVDAVKKEFPAAKKVEMLRKGVYMLHFDSAETKAKVLKSSEGKEMEGRPLRLITSDKKDQDICVFVSSIAFDATREEILAAFPGCKSVFMKKNKDGKFSGLANVYFETKEKAEAAIKNAANKQIKGRPVKVKLQGADAAPAEKKETKPTAAAEKKPVAKKAEKELPKQVASESEEDEDDDDDDHEDAEGSDEDDEDSDNEDAEGSDDDDEDVDDDDDASEDDGKDEDDDEDDDDESDEEPVAKRPKTAESPATTPNRPQQSRGGPRGGFRGNGGGGFNRGGRGGNFRGGPRGGGFQSRGGRGGNRFSPRGGRGGAGGRGRGNFRH